MYKIIRDAVHGDIAVDEKFLKVIDTKEFQRLHRIKQLSVADMIFPGATHSRFSHSLGTYYVMTLFIDHFKKVLNETGSATFSDDDVKVILLAALLHDLGHGPFSHAFEIVSKKLDIEKKHEEWTCELIISEETEINKVLKNEFGNDIPQKVVDVIKHQQSVKNKLSGSLQHLDLSSILSSLISSQLDADRIDYLLRDSFFCGVKFGNIDIQRIINSLQLTVMNNDYFVCIPEKFVPDIEAYVLARYQMSKIVYYHDLKICFEDLIVKILSRAKDLYKNRKLSEIPLFFKHFFDNSLSVNDYIELDDYSLTSQFQIWKNVNDEELKTLCNQFIYRNTLSKTNILDNSNDKINEFKIQLKELFDKYGYKINDFKNELFWTEGEKDFSAYSVKKENIWVLRNNGVVEDFKNVSKLFNELDNTDDSGKLLKNNGNAVYINYQLIRFLNVEKYEKLEQDIRTLVQDYNARNNIEIEKKYIVNNTTVFNEVLEFFKNKDYFVKEKERKQLDTYFDTDDYKLLNNGITVRIRKMENKNEMTVKLPITSNIETVGSERFEYKKNLGSKKSIDYKFFNYNTRELDLKINSNSLKESLIISNTRRAVTVQKDSVIFEIALDTVNYAIPKKSDDIKEEFQIEIELKSSYLHRINLQNISSDLERTLGDKLEISNDSKYKRGLLKFGIKIS